MSELSLLNVENLSVGFVSDGQSSSAVNGVSFHIKHGETVGLVGESGSGKSVSALSILKLLPYPTAFHESGKIYFDDVDLMAQPDHVLRSVRGNRISMIFQEPMSSLNPLHSIEKQISEIIELHQGLDRAAARAETLRLLTRVGIPNAEKRLKALPHELSGGQRQRVMIAMALANQPDLLIADEPTTALDVTIQKQILDLLQELQSEFGMSILLITHDLGVVKKMADRIYVMQNGGIVEDGPVEAIFDAPQHDYTKQLIAAEPHGHAPPLTAQDILVEAEDLRVWFPVK
ncbi:MAG: ATP-binding cassette domain-containing protein, partial [Parvibaculales bacterium]